MRILESLPDRFEVCFGAGCGNGHYNERFHVKIESGAEVESRGPTWRIATPLV